MIIFSVETSCDETALALVEAKGDGNNPQFKTIKSLVASQIKIHAPFGGVVPSLAKREHEKNLPILFEKIFSGKIKMKNVDLIAVTVGPGLEPALWTGITFAKKISEKYKKPIIGVNHLEGHLYSFLLSLNAKKDGRFDFFPGIGLVVSGGHTILVLMKNLFEYKKLGETCDDAIGECFDKVARILNLPYPGGPEIEKLAKNGDDRKIQFPSPMVNQKNYNFSYSGLKTAVLYHLKGIQKEKNSHLWTSPKNGKRISKNDLKNNADVSASFQRAAFEVVAKKTLRAVKEFGAKSIFVGGGVAANKNLKKRIENEAKKNGSAVSIFIPPFKYCQDNGVMIAVAGFMNHLKNKKYKLEAEGNLNF